jgi:hypothetical protein
MEIGSEPHLICNLANSTASKMRTCACCLLASSPTRSA